MISIEYLQYFDYHISLKIIDFHLMLNHSNSALLEELYKIKTSKLFSTFLFNEQESYLKSNKLEDKSVQKINERKEYISNLEVELKIKIIDFLQLAESCRSLNDYNTSTSYRKKIVNFLFILDWRNSFWQAFAILQNYIWEWSSWRSKNNGEWRL